MTWRFWTWRKKRRAHKSPPLAVVRGQRDDALRRIRHLENELRDLKAGNDSAWSEVAFLRRRLATMANAMAVRVPAPMARPVQTAPPAYTPKPRPAPRISEYRGSDVIPLWQAHGGLRYGRS